MQRLLTRARLGGALAAALVCAPLMVDAQVEVGDKAPKIEAKALANTKVKSLDRLKGRLILYEYFAHW